MKIKTVLNFIFAEFCCHSSHLRPSNSSVASGSRPGPVQPSRSRFVEVMRLVLGFVLMPLVLSASSEAQKLNKAEANAPTLPRGIQQICRIWTHPGTTSQITFQIYRNCYLE